MKNKLKKLPNHITKPNPNPNPKPYNQNPKHSPNRNLTLPYITLTLHYVTLRDVDIHLVRRHCCCLVRRCNNITLIDSANGHFSL